MSQVSRLPQTFLRGLEADLRALCADARRRNPEVKEAAERVILLLKEADSAESEAEAADEAASAFCAACEVPDLNSSTSAGAVQVKVALRAVSCLHKLLTHRALSTTRLPEVLAALERLGSASIDDNITLKVLQGLLSLLTVRSYAQSLSEDDLSRAFSLLFILRTSRSINSGNAASNALSAISQMSGSNEHGVIEQTSKAAFRQVSSDLFASAADAAVRTAVEREAPAGARIPLSVFPSEARAAYSLFVDLCSAAGGDDLKWLTHNNDTNVAQVVGLDLGLALEVIDDSLASNIALFAGHAVFADVLSGTLCPKIHKLLRTTEEKTTLKSLLGLIVTLVRGYWRDLRPDSEALLYALANMSTIDASQEVGWGTIYAMEALRCIFRSGQNESSPLIDFVQAFDLGGSTGKSVSGVIASACEAMASLKDVELHSLPSTPINGRLKPFANTIVRSRECFVAIATGLYIEVVKAAEEAVKKELQDTAVALLPSNTTSKAVVLLGTMIGDASSSSGPTVPRADDDAFIAALTSLSKALGQIASSSEYCGLGTTREESLSTLALACKNVIRSRPDTFDLTAEFGRRVSVLYDVLFEVQRKCRGALARSWLPVVEALEALDELMYNVDNLGDSDSSKFASVSAVLKPKLDEVFTATQNLRWTSCHDLISALVQCSRQSIAAITKRISIDEQPKGDTDVVVKVFGVERAETVIVNAFQRENSGSDVMPCTLWQLLTGHLTSVCTDATLQSLRLFALSSLTRIACRAIPSGTPPFVSHDKIITPFLDLLSATHTDIRAGALSAVYTILEAQGDHLEGEAAWTVVLKTICTATGSSIAEVGKDGDSDSRNSTTGSQAAASVVGGGEMVSEGFKVVHLMADDYLTSLGQQTLPLWMEVLGLYCRQNEDVNVALTSIGLLWRTADILAKDSDRPDEDKLWVQLFEILKDVSMDGRPEIRNCAVKTLTGTLQAHSFRLSALAWNGCAARALLPLLEQVMQAGAVRPHSDEVHASGKGRGDMQLLLHHSRDTPRKQWNETRVLALAGVAKVLRTAMPRLAVLRDGDRRPLFLMLTDGGADGLWRKMLRAAGVAAASRDGEVAVAGVSALLELLSAAGFVVDDQVAEPESAADSKLEASVSAPASLGTGKSDSSSPVSWIAGVIGGADLASSEKSMEEPMVKRRSIDSDISRGGSRASAIVLWEAVWIALAEAVRGSDDPEANKSAERETRGSRIVEERALKMLGQGLVDARVSLAHKFTSSSSQMLVEVLMDLAFGRRDEASHAEGRAPCVLTDVQKVTLTGLQDMSFGKDEQSWVRLIQGLLGILREQATMTGEAGQLVRRVLGILSRQYASIELPGTVKTSELGGLLRALEKIVLSRGKTAGGRARYGDGFDSDVPLWVVGTETLIAAMKHGLQASSAPPTAEVWEVFVRVVEQLLYADQSARRGNAYSRNVSDGERAEELDMRVADCVTAAARRAGSNADDRTKRELVRLLGRGAEEKESGRPRFVRACQRNLFRLAGAGGEGERRAGDEAARCVIETCGRVLGQFIADGLRAGRCPLPAARRAEAVFVLQQLRRLCGPGGARGGEVYVAELYGRLCECVDCRDEAVRGLARELLDEAAPAVGTGGAKAVAVVRA